MDPEKRLETDDEMPPIDDELREAMEAVAVRQRKCLGLQKLLALLGMVCFGNVVGVGALFANVIVAIIWGNRLSHRGWKLVKKAYPWLHNIPFLCGMPGGKHYNGITAGRRIWEEAKRLGDDLTVGLLDFEGRSMGWIFLGTLGYILVLVFVTWK